MNFRLTGILSLAATFLALVILFWDQDDDTARARLETLRTTADGFAIAEKDLALRGPGELLGTRQTGLAAFRIADLARDADLLPEVHALADRLLREAPALADRIIDRWVGGAARYASA